MNRLFILALAWVLTTGSAFAQSNEADVTQNGNGSSATIEQQGSSQEAVVVQNSLFGTGHTADVTQSGDANLADVSQGQANAEAYIRQSGTENVAKSQQSGYNVLNIEQVGNRNVLEGRTADSRAFQKNGTGIFADDANFLNVSQDGDDNVASVWQEHHASGVISQMGDGHYGMIYQTGAPGGAINAASISQTGSGHVAEISQVGDGNDASIDQSLSIHAGLATTSQTGDANSASQTQNGNQFQVGSYAMIDQVGVGNTATQIQNVWGHPGLRIVDVEQRGEGNTAFQDQRHAGGGGDVELIALQIGDNNSVEQIQSGSTGSKWCSVGKIG